MYRPQHQTIAIALILLTYLLIGGLYATLTPEWQVPDEPAHYNYVRQLAAGSIPVIELGDYDQAYLEELKGSGFPPENPIEGIQYEDHQPPLYYLLASPVYLLFNGDLLPLRLFSLTLGALALLVCWRIGRRLFPNRPVVTVTAVALMAFIPQHIAMMAGVNNDSLAELLLAVALLGAVLILEGKELPSPWALGLLLGAVFLTKSQAYIAAPILLVAMMIRWRRDRRGVDWLVGYGARLLIPASLLGLAWWGRNIATYGGMDWMGLSQHDLVVTGQPTTAGWIAEHGLPATLQRFVRFTFQSFWGMFGWMAVPMNAIAYQGAAVLSAMTGIAFGLLFFSRRGQRKGKGVGPAVVLVLVLSALISALGYLWWNISFVQHQGRYLFPALVPIGMAAGVAWEWLAYKRAARWVGVLFVVGSIGALATGNRFLAVIMGSAGGLVWLNSQLALRFRWLLPAIMHLGLALFALASLFLFIIPWLN